MSHKTDPAKIAQLLTIGVSQLDEETVSALSSAREKALERQAVSSHALALSSVRWTRSWIRHGTQSWVALALVLALLVLGTGFLHQVQEQQNVDTDVAILTDDVPMDAFVD
jgi:type VI protein secretion system component VasK